jgi:hypothetical protein
MEEKNKFESSVLTFKPGLSSRIAAFSNPLASSELNGERTFNPGQCEYHAE